MIFIKIIFLENGVKVILFVLSLRRLNKQQKVILKMEDEKITLAEPELPQLRQTVLENTRRISRNEQMIDQMRKKEVEEERKRRERDEFWENVRREHALAQQEHDRDMREIRESLKRTQKLSEENAEGLKETRVLVNENAEGLKETRALVNENAEGLKEIRKLSKETHELVKESSKLVKENSELVKENSEIVKENSEQLKRQVDETTKIIREMSIQFMGRTGHIVEGLLSSSAEKVFQEAGFDLYNHGKNLIRKFKTENKQMEVDVLLSNDEFAVPIEVKTNCTKADVHKILHQMGLFRDLFPEYADKEVIAAVAAINYEKGVDDLARDEGLLVIRVNSDDIFSLDSFDKEALRRF